MKRILYNIVVIILMSLGCVFIGTIWVALGHTFNLNKYVEMILSGLSGGVWAVLSSKAIE